MTPNVDRLPLQQRVAGDALGKVLVGRDQSRYDFTVVQEAIQELRLIRREGEDRFEAVTAMLDEGRHPVFPTPAHPLGRYA